MPGLQGKGLDSSIGVVGTLPQANLLRGDSEEIDHIVHQPKKSGGSRRFCDFLKRERKVQSHAGLDSAENSTFPHSGATLREAGGPLRHGIVGSDPQLPADVGDGRRLPIQLPGWAPP